MLEGVLLINNNINHHHNQTNLICQLILQENQVYNIHIFFFFLGYPY